MGRGSISVRNSNKFSSQVVAAARGLAGQPGFAEESDGGGVYVVILFFGCRALQLRRPYHTPTSLFDMDGAKVCVCLTKSRIVLHPPLGEAEACRHLRTANGMGNRRGRKVTTESEWDGGGGAARKESRIIYGVSGRQEVGKEERSRERVNGDEEVWQETRSRPKEQPTALEISLSDA